jgi:hypothetical protein
MSDTTAALAGVEVLDSAGRPVRLGDFWAETPVVLVLVRHFG